VSSTEQTITLATTSLTGKFYATQTSTTPITSVVIPAGQSATSVYYSDTRAGTPTVTAADTALDSTSAQQVAVTPGPPSQIAFTSAPLEIVEGSLGQVTITLEDFYGNPTTSASDQTISLGSSSGTGLFYASQTATTPTTTVVILAGQTSVSFYYDDTTVGTPIVLRPPSRKRSRPHRPARSRSRARL
jgi:hypothetical protein